MSYLKSWIVKLITIYFVVQAKLMLKRHRPYIVAITGSFGKTSTKNLIGQMLGSKARQSPASYNGELGVALSILGLTSPDREYWNWIWRFLDAPIELLFNNQYPPVLILEIGAGTPGEIPKLTKWLKPNVAVLTALPAVPSHVEKYKNGASVVDDKIALLTAAEKVIGNGDEPIIKKLLKEKFPVAQFYTKKGGLELVVNSYDLVVDHTSPYGFIAGSQISYTLGGEAHVCEVRRGAGEAYLLAFCGAFTAVQVISKDLKLPINLPKHVMATAGRVYLRAGMKETLLIDDAFNAAPHSMINGLELLKEIQTPGKKIAVLGDMLELGEYTIPLHETIGQMVGECATRLVLVGPRAKFIGEKAVSLGFLAEHVKFFNSGDDFATVANYVKEIMGAGDIIFLKGSHGMKLYKVVDALKSWE